MQFSLHSTMVSLDVIQSLIAISSIFQEWWPCLTPFHQLLSSDEKYFGFHFRNHIQILIRLEREYWHAHRSFLLREGEVRIVYFVPSSFEVTQVNVAIMMSMCESGDLGSQSKSGCVPCHSWRGTPEKILYHPLKKYVCGFMSSAVLQLMPSSCTSLCWRQNVLTCSDSYLEPQQQHLCCV